jgi:histidinol-phosphate aminotransferase
MRARVHDVAESRAKLTRALRELGMRPLESTANFVFVPVTDAALVAAHMRTAGVAVRPFTAVRGVGDGVRITVGPWPMMETAIAALENAVVQ